MADIKVRVGDPLPDFDLEAYPSGGTAKLSSYRGRWLVLYFYPRDDTSGCTKEACSFRDSTSSIRALGAEVVGVSTDSISSHRKFAGKFNLGFTLLSDPKGELGSRLGVLKENGTSMYRVTFLVDSEGRIAKIYPKVDPSIHADEVMADLKALRER
ncbi:MAG TPA: peroxiredoxin [Conexivisphaerales archaeon]|nr:peroxiredoxin [Conexivisphaerales archaeon]